MNLIVTLWGEGKFRDQWDADKKRDRRPSKSQFN